MKKMILKLKKVKPLVFILALASCILVGITIAIVHSYSEFNNEFKVGAYKVALEEEFYDDWGTKKASIVNHGTTPVVLRVNYNEKWFYLEEGMQVLLSTTYKGEELATKEWTKEWQNDFVKGPDGWYYYKYVLEHEKSVPLLNQITKNESAISLTQEKTQYDKSDYELDFNYETIAVDTTAIKELWGHKATITDNSITWSFE